MVILLVSDCQTKATRLRHLLAQNGYECPLGNVVPVEAAESTASCFYPKPDLILFVLSNDIERSQAALHHLHELSDVQVVAVGPRDPNLILGALHAGAASYLDESSDLQRDLSSILSRLSAAEHKPSTMGRLTTVVAASGGSGRTLVATNLAVALAKRQGRCGLFDIDVNGADVAPYLNLKPRHSIADLCRNIDKLDLKMFEQSLLEHESGVSVLAAPDAWEETKYVTGDGLQKILRFGRSIFPNVVADLDAFWTNDFAQALQQSNAVVLLVRFDFAAIRNARRALAAFDKAGVDRGKVLLVAARYGRHKEITAAQVESALGLKIGNYVPEDAQTANSCINCGVPIVLEAPGSSIAKSIAAIAETIAAQPLDGSAVSPANRGGARFADKVRAFLGMSLQEMAHER